MRRRPSFSPGVLIDTSAYFALTDRDDNNAPVAQTVLTDLAQRRVRLFTTDLIIAETHALILNRLNRSLATRFLRAILAGGYTIVWVTPEDIERAAEIIEQYDDKDFSLTDATSFAVMERLGIAHAFTFDNHFSQYGLQVLSAL